MSIRERKKPTTASEMLIRALLYIFLTAGAFAMVAPLIWMILSAFKTQAEITRIPPTWIPENFTWANFQRIFTVMPFGRFYLNSVFVAVVVTLSTLFFCSLGGYVFAKYQFPGRDFIFLALLSTMMIPFVVRMIPLYIIIYKFGWVDTYMGLISPALMSAFGIFLMRQFMQSIPSELMDAARIDGCSEFAIFWRIMLPLCGPVLASLGIFSFMWNWDSFLWPLVVTNSLRVRTLPVGLASFTGQYSTDYGATMAAAFISVLPVLIVFFAMQRHFIEGITLTGLKG